MAAPDKYRRFTLGWYLVASVDYAVFNYLAVASGSSSMTLNNADIDG
jgi:hypothetical protein